MVLPITGPISRNYTTATHYEIGDVVDYRSVYKQVKPYTIPLPYSMRSSRNVSGGGKSGSQPIANWWSQTNLDEIGGEVIEIPNLDSAAQANFLRFRAAVLNKARERFMRKANHRVSLSVDILQRKQAYAMLVKRATQAGRIFSNLKRGKFREALSELGISKPSGWQPVVRNAGALWLEYSYGWKPLVQDIFEASSVLSAPIDDLWIHESRAEQYDRYVIQQNRNPFDHWTDKDNKISVKVFSRVGAVVSCDNPNLQALKNAGLTNPLSWAWELIPFSFVVDWFLGVGAFIESLDDTVGLTVKDGFYSQGWTGTSRISIKVVQVYLDPSNPLNGKIAWKLRSVAGLDRIRGIPSVVVARKLQVLTSLDRGLNAASLLAQLLRK